ncbi:hypothetical protein PMAYCL1PPCAC_22920 [Pristionchus mayeri]|uniref:Uncharacterized protein n=1 Tax=Pristionchus mayeri TaxID=1317129 RepID=A0AAN5I626_9BILA|nr:hypothetical protein PMAYCL1PPCAC_22920 [Pristionchus mayeri]
MRKSEFASKWKEEGFIDCLRDRWITNVQGSSSSAIDYVMTSKSSLRDLLVHKPVRPLGTNLHLLVPFNVGPALEDYQWCARVVLLVRLVDLHV